MSKNAEGWIRHNSKQQPVDDHVEVEIRTRGGDYEICEASGFAWNETGEDQIIAYRLHKPAEHVEPFIEAVQAFNALAKVPQLDGPIGWRDRITEIDATTQALTAERAELVQKLASEGFALIEREPGAPIGLPRDEWKVGDLVMLKCKSLKTDMPVGKPLPITEFDGSSFGQDVKVDGFYFPMVSDLTWHSRPSA